MTLPQGRDELSARRMAVWWTFRAPSLVVRPFVFDRFQNRVQSFEFHTGVSGGELPVNLHLRSVTGALPGSDFACQREEVWDAAVEALSPQHPECDFRHVERAWRCWG